MAQAHLINSIRSSLKQLTPEAKTAVLSQLTNEEAEHISTAWDIWARPEQLEPLGDWQFWLILAGRGWGKTRTGAEWVKQRVKHSHYVNLIGATSGDARDIMILGESGILACCNRWERPKYNENKNRLTWPNGAVSLIFTAEEPERLRGKQHSDVWADEVAAWRYAESWDQVKFGLRLGDRPRACLTTTPKPTKLVKEIASDPLTFITRGTTYDNKANLAGNFLTGIIKKYEGTRLGRQELNAEILEDNPNALWQRSNIDKNRVSGLPPMKRIVVAVDPAVTSSEDSDETGIIVIGRGFDDHGYVFGDFSLTSTPLEWAKAVLFAYRDTKANIIVAETNNGGDLVESNLRVLSTKLNIHFKYKKVHASRGKAIRAEPAASLYEQDRIHHVGFLSALEDQMCDFNPKFDTTSPDRVDALVWGLWELFDLDQDNNRGILEYYRQLAGK